MTVGARPAVSVRPLEASDLAAIVRLDALHTGLPKPDYWQRVVREFVEPSDERARVGLVAVSEGEVTGFVLADVRAFEFGSEPCGWILEVGVEPRFARQGVASRLLAEAGRRLRAHGVTTVRTMVRRNDVPMLTFFRTNGFAGGPFVQLELSLDAAESSRAADGTSDD